MTEVPRRKGSFVNEATAWGSHITADFIVAESDRMRGVDGSRDIFVIRDHFTGLKHAYPCPDRQVENVVTCIKSFLGPDASRVHELYSDAGKELIAAAKEIGAISRTSQPGIFEIKRCDRTYQQRDRDDG